MTRPRTQALLAALLLLVPFTGLVAVVLVTAPGVFGVDADLARLARRPARAEPALATALEVVAFVTLPTWLRILAVLVGIELWRRGRRRAAGWLVGTMLAGGALAIGLKQVFARSRPEWPDAVTVASGYSFPSGHAVSSLLAAGCALVLLWPRLARAGRRVAVAAAAAFVLLVGLDRMLLGVHYLTDVLAGWTLATAVLLAGLAAAGGTPDGRPRPREPV